MEWSTNNVYLYGEYKKDQFKIRSKLAMFDLDGTLIQTKTGHKFPKDKNDWKLFSTNIPKKIKEHSRDFSIIIISNQAGLHNNQKKTDEWKAKLDMITILFDVPLRVYCSTNHDIYRKPYPKFFELMTKELKQQKIDVDLINSFYCGDACGRSSDHSDCDYKFALNSKVNFILPEKLFDNIQTKVPDIKYPVINEINSYINIKQPDFIFTIKEMIIMVGFQGSGKSTFVNNILVPLGYVRINQDLLKTKQKCLKQVNNEMKLNNSVVIDNTNPSNSIRGEYIKLGYKYGYNIKCVKMDVSEDYARHNASYRTYKYGIKSMPIAFIMYKKNYNEPLLTEGINEIIKMKQKLDKNTLDSDYFMYLI